MPAGPDASLYTARERTRGQVCGRGIGGRREKSIISCGDNSKPRKISVTRAGRPYTSKEHTETTFFVQPINVRIYRKYIRKARKRIRITSKGERSELR